MYHPILKACLNFSKDCLSDQFAGVMVYIISKRSVVMTMYQTILKDCHTDQLTDDFDYHQVLH